jgi:NUMOD4 motif/HNH endonuclease
MDEAWRPVVGWEDKYLVSNRGQVMSLISHRLMKLQPKSGYWVVKLSGKGKQYSRYVHRLVLEAFDGPCPEGMECCHGPSGGQDNRWPENLRWDTPKANRADLVAHGTAWWLGHERCPNGHEYTEENTYVTRSKRNGTLSRHCRKCRRERWRERNGVTGRVNRTKYNPDAV